MTATLRGNAMPRSAGRGLPWWLLLVSGAAWLVICWFVLGFNDTAVRSIATLAGIVVLVAAVHELLLAFTAPGWKWLHTLLAVLFVITGVVILANPGRSFVWLAAFIGWYLLFKGIADIVLSFATKLENDAWWLLLIVGIVEVLLGFWAAGRFTRSAYLLVVFVAAIALSRAIGDVVMAFRLRGVQHELAGRG
jgi:uncharacterized membrane protein HdeD (DUF308 family)